jgi:hypothetical protein
MLGRLQGELSAQLKASNLLDWLFCIDSLLLLS